MLHCFNEEYLLIKINWFCSLKMASRRSALIASKYAWIPLVEGDEGLHLAK